MIFHTLQCKGKIHFHAVASAHLSSVDMQGCAFMWLFLMHDRSLLYVLAVTHTSCRGPYDVLHDKCNRDTLSHEMSSLGTSFVFIWLDVRGICLPDLAAYDRQAYLF